MEGKTDAWAWLMRIVNVLRLEKGGSLGSNTVEAATNGGTSGQVGSETRPHQNIMLLRHFMHFTSQRGTAKFPTIHNSKTNCKHNFK